MRRFLTSPIRSRLSASCSVVPYQSLPLLLFAPLEGLEELFVPQRGTVHLPANIATKETGQVFATQ